jgi:acyl-homoserine-lactone acylase
MNVRTRVALGVALALVAAVVVVVRTYEPSQAAEGRYAAEIRRTEYGIPHISAKDHGGLGYGYGYAFAQDNLCVLASWAVTLRGERSRYFGAQAMSDDPIRPVANLTSDVYYKGMRESGVLRRLLAQPAPLGPTRELRELVDGYVAGYNRYLAETGVAGLPDPTCRGKEWVGPITAMDMWSNVLDLGRMAGTSEFKEALTAESTGDAGPVRRGETPGSNGWALGREATRGGTGMLLADPHYPWNGIRRFYQVQLTIPGVLDVSGGSLYGTPVVQIGHTQSLAWTHTVSHAQRFTLFKLDLVPGQPTRYLVDGHPEPMGRQKVTVTVKDPGGTVSAVTRTLSTSRYGPVITTGLSDKSAFALADANATNLRSMNEWLAMGSARNLTQLRQAQNTYQGLPFVYTLATDSGGTAYLADASVVPNVTDAQAKRCITSPEGKERYPDTYVLDGSTSACGWGSDPDAVEPGIFGPAAQPTLTRADYVANSNDSPWLTNPAEPLTGYPRIFGDSGTELEMRPRVSHDMITRRLAGSDGLGKPGFTLDTLRTTVRAKRNLSAELGRADLVAMCRAHPVLDGVDVREACHVLAGWDGRALAGSGGAVLWREFYTRLNVPVRDDGGAPLPPKSWWLVPFDPAHPLTTPRGLDVDGSTVRHALAEAVRFFRDNGIPPALTPAQAQHYGAVPVPGCTEGEGCFDRVRMRGDLGANGRYPDVDTGSSFMMAVELTPQGSRTRTILTYSLSANPESPHHTDQTELSARGRWVTERFTEAEIASDPKLRTTILSPAGQGG